MEHSDDVRVLHEEIASLKAKNEDLRDAARTVSDELERAYHRSTLGYQLGTAVWRFWQDILHWKFVVLILAIEAVRLGIDISRLER